MSNFLVCPRCRKESKDLHEDDGLCPKCEGEWVNSYLTDPNGPLIKAFNGTKRKAKGQQNFWRWLADHFE